MQGAHEEGRTAYHCQFHLVLLAYPRQFCGAFVEFCLGGQLVKCEQGFHPLFVGRLNYSNLHLFRCGVVLCKVEDFFHVLVSDYQPSPGQAVMMFSPWRT